MISLSPSRTFKALLSCALFAFGALSHAQQVFRVTTIPEEAATEQVRKFTPIASYLERKLGMKVEFTPVSDYPAAVEAYRGVLRVDSTKQFATLAYSGIGTALERIGKPDEAIAACRRSIELDSTNIWALCCWARALMKKGEMTEAAAMLERARAINAADWVAYHFVLLDAQTSRHTPALERLEPLLTKIPILDYEELQSEPLLAPLRNLPEWHAFLKKHFQK